LGEALEEEVGVSGILHDLTSEVIEAEAWVLLEYVEGPEMRNQPSP